MEQPPLEELNDTELWEVARITLAHVCPEPVRLLRSLSRERVIQLIEMNMPPSPHELALSTRTKLAVWIAENRVLIQSQLPCKGIGQGECRSYPCTDSRHLDCYEGAKRYFI